MQLNTPNPPSSQNNGKKKGKNTKKRNQRQGGTLNGRIYRVGPISKVEINLLIKVLTTQSNKEIKMVFRLTFLVQYMGSMVITQPLGPNHLILESKRGYGQSWTQWPNYNQPTICCIVNSLASTQCPSQPTRGWYLSPPHFFNGKSTRCCQQGHLYEFNVYPYLHPPLQLQHASSSQPCFN